MSDFKDNRNTDMETANKLLHDLGEIDDRFVEKAADTNITVTTKGKRFPWAGAACAAAAAVLLIVIGSNLPERSRDPFSPALTDVSLTEPSVSEKDGSAPVTGDEKAVTVIETVLSEVTGISGAETLNGAETSPAVTETEEQVTVSSSEPADAKKENTDPGAYPYPEDIKADHAAVTKNSDGSLRVTLGNGKFALTLPADWEGHFVITSGEFCAKKAFYDGGGDGGLFGYHIGDLSDENDAFNAGFRNIPEWSALRGVSGNTYLSTSRVSDVRYDGNDAEQRDEYTRLASEISAILTGTESYSEQSGRMEKVMYLPDSDYFRAHIEAWYSVKAERERNGIDYSYRAYDDDYVLSGGPEENNRYWELEEGWHVMAKRAVQCEHGLFYDCVDADDGDHYKWVPAEDVTFELVSGH